MGVTVLLLEPQMYLLLVQATQVTGELHFPIMDLAFPSLLLDKELLAQHQAINIYLEMVQVRQLPLLPELQHCTYREILTRLRKM